MERGKREKKERQKDDKKTNANERITQLKKEKKKQGTQKEKQK